MHHVHVTDMPGPPLNHYAIIRNCMLTGGVDCNIEMLQDQPLS